MIEIIKLTIMIISGLVITFSGTLLFIFYRRYYKYLKESYHDEWWKLMSKDPLVEAAGEWIRWPLGSIYLIKSAFVLDKYYNDERVRIYKRKIVILFISFVGSFVLFLISAILLPK